MDFAELLKKLKAEGLSDEDAIKLLQGEFEAANKGLIQKRDELLAQEKALKDKVTGLETSATEFAKTKLELEAQLKKANPEEHKAYYEGKAKELETKHAAELQAVATERDRYRTDHEARIRDDAIAEEATKDLKFIDGLRDGFISLAMSKNQFSAKEIDGKTVFTNQDNKTIQAILHEFSLSDEGKAYIKNGNAGGGGQGGNNQPGGTGGTKGKAMSRSDFDGLGDTQKQEFMNGGGIITE